LRDGDLRCFGHAVMDHLLRDLDCALAGDEDEDEDDATPVGLPHRGQIQPGKAYAAQDVYLEKPNPIFVREVLEWLGLKAELPNTPDERNPQKEITRQRYLAGYSIRASLQR
jgi:hypothetical protein